MHEESGRVSLSDVYYAQSDGLNIAYKLIGDGPVDLMFVSTWFSNLDFFDQHPSVFRTFERMASFARVVAWDRRGTGLSDRLRGIATLEEGMDDLIAVLDHAGVEHTVLFGFNESAPLCALTAATHPERVGALVLYGAYATTTWHEDYPWGQKPEEHALQIEWMSQNWGSKEIAGLMLMTDDESLLEWGARWLRGSVSRDLLPLAYDTLALTDVRHVLETITVPTLVLHRAGDPTVPVDNGRYLGRKIPNAKYVELEGNQHPPFLGDWEAVIDEIEEFLTGHRRVREEDRVLATILFTDIVDSTGKAVEFGDARWREVLDAHDREAASIVQQFNGRVIKSTGDGILASFDGPARAIRCARRLESAVRALGLSVRCGLHTGEVEVRGNDLGGIAVHIGARVAALAQPGEVLVSGAIPPLVAGAGIEFADRGSHELKGVTGRWDLFAVAGA